MEDLWAFNEEVVARAIFDCKTPIISAVGHETDFTIADFAADMRAATPSAAAELAVPVIAELRQNLNAVMERVSAGLGHLGRVRRGELERVLASHVFRAPADALLLKRRERLERFWECARTAELARMGALRAELARLEAKIDALSPAGVLRRGYACVSVQGRVLSSAEELTEGMKIDIRLRDGSAQAEVLKTTIMEDDHGE